MNIRSIPGISVINSTDYSKTLVLKNYSIKDHASLASALKSEGYEEIFKKTELALSTGVYKKDGEVVTLCRDSATAEMRIMWEEEKYNSTEPIKSPETVGDGETVMSQIGVGAYGQYDDDPMIGMLYIIKNSDGHAIIIDGGLPTEGNADDVLKALSSHKIAKDSNGKFIIDAWIFTHAHNDHVGAFNAFAIKHPDKAAVNYFLYNMPTDTKVAPPATDAPVFESHIDLFAPAKRVIPRMGQIYYFGNVKVTMLFSPDMIYVPGVVIPYYNDAGITFAVEAEGVKALFMGDAGEVAAQKMVQCIRPSTLKSYFVQITHHGLYTSGYLTPHSAEERAIMTREERNAWEAERHINKNLTKLYEAAAPQIGLWPMGDTNGQPRNGRTTVMRDWSREYGQTAYFVDTSREDSGYDGVNIVKKGDLITYTMSSETELMITKFTFKNGEVTLDENRTWESFLADNT